MKVLLFWLARAALTLVALAVLWMAGWQHWTSVFGAVLIAYLITYLMFGSLYDGAAKQLDQFIDAKLRRAQREDADAEDAEAAAAP